MKVLVLAGEPHGLTAILAALEQRGDAIVLAVDAQAGADPAAMADLAAEHDAEVVVVPAAPLSPVAWLYGLGLSGGAVSSGDMQVVATLPAEPAAQALLTEQGIEAVLHEPLGRPDAMTVEVIRAARGQGLPVAAFTPGGTVPDLGPAVVAPAGAWWVPLVRPLVMRRVARLAQAPEARQAREARRDWLREHRLDAAALRKAAAVSAKAHALAQREQRREALAAQREATRVAYETLIDTAVANLQRVRAWAGALDRPADLTASERETVAALAPWWQADRDRVAVWRQAGAAITGVRPDDYHSEVDSLALVLRRDLSAIRKQLGDDLFVQEPRLLGGFGIERAQELYNQDTLTYFHALAALQDGGLLSALRGGRERRLVWEIGGGWGGFAHQVRTLCPEVTYVITGLPDTLLVAATYLMSALPQARVVLAGEGGRPIDWHGWEQADVILAPEGALREAPPRLDLVLDLNTFRVMSEARIEAHVQQAFDAGARYLYSMAPLSEAALAAARAWPRIERWFWPHPVPPRGPIGVAYPPPSIPEFGFSHLIGWRRLHV